MMALLLKMEWLTLVKNRYCFETTSIETIFWTASNSIRNFCLIIGTNIDFFESWFSHKFSYFLSLFISICSFSRWKMNLDGFIFGGIMLESWVLSIQLGAELIMLFFVELDAHWLCSDAVCSQLRKDIFALDLVLWRSFWYADFIHGDSIILNVLVCWFLSLATIDWDPKFCFC